MSQPRDLPPLNALRAFESTARLGSVSRAAAELHVTHGAVSRQLRALEEHLGVALLASDGRGVKLTDAGLRLSAAAAAAAAAAGEAPLAVRRLGWRDLPEVERHLLSLGPQDHVLYVSPAYPELHSLLQTLLPQAQRSGLIRRLAREHYRQVFEPPISLQQRRVIHLQMAAPL